MHDDPEHLLYLVYPQLLDVVIEGGGWGEVASAAPG